MEKYLSSLGQRLRSVLKDNGVKTTELAEHLKVHRNTVNHWLNDRRKPSVETLKIICHWFGADLKWVIEGDETENGKADDEKKSYKTKKDRMLEDLTVDLNKLDEIQLNLIQNMVKQILGKK